ncbi:hypothetical protein L1987_48546 [Smallanthus sonchifolius]|uniref:Uncharacterized protein n=1 Tax=Smallanthus sonchifolius TaxID=185202 RepID=A0ACB9FS85_9ASTR|nr:hypothetical protein L1987_48546 [Smallanthus sonchifolius]
MEDFTPYDTPIPVNHKLNSGQDGKEVDCRLYHAMIGSLLYLTASKPDIMFAVCICSRFQAKPKESHLIAVKRIFCYMKGKQRLGLWFPHGSNFEFNAYTDSDFGGCCLDRKSTTGGCQFLDLVDPTAIKRLWFEFLIKMTGLDRIHATDGSSQECDMLKVKKLFMAKMARHVEYKHNQVPLLDPNMPEAIHFQGIINFLNRSRLHVALSANPYISLPYIQQFWDTVHHDTDVEPHVLHATSNNTEVAISVETIRAALALGGANDDPMSYPGTMIMGCFQRMGYRGRPNDTQARKGATDSDSSRDFSSDHYERLATLPLANAGKRIKSKANKPRRKSVRNPPSGSVHGKRTLIDESSDSDSDAIPVPKAQKLMSASIAAAHSSQDVEDATFVASLLVTPLTSKHPSPVISPNVPHTSDAGPSKPSDYERITFLESHVLDLQTLLDTLVYTDTQRQLDDDDNDPSGNIEGDRQYADVDPISRVPGDSISVNIEGTKNDFGVNEDILLLEFFADSEEEEAEKLEFLDDIDELFDDFEEDVMDNDVEEGEIVEIEIEKSKDKVTYEGSDGLNVSYNFIQDVVIPEFSCNGVTDSMDSVEDITTPDDTAQSKIDSDVDTTHTVSPKLNEEPVMYRNTRMTRE